MMTTDSHDLNYSTEYKVKLETAWLNYWSEQGENILHSSWVDKYGEFVIDNCNELSNNVKDIEEEEEEDNNEILNEYSSAWHDIWKEHCENEFRVQYEQFCKKFNEEDITKEVLVETETETDDSNLDKKEEIFVISSEDANLLNSYPNQPRSFGRRKRLKKSKKLKVKKVIYSKEEEKEKEETVENMDYDFSFGKRRTFISWDEEKLPIEIKENKRLYKYWLRRYSLFSSFDAGIKLDAESWFSVTPEKIAIDIADSFKCDIIIDAFCGCGGNTIQFAKTCKKVIAIDIDSKKIEYAHNNAKIYNVDHKIDFIIGDFFKLSKNLVADAVFLSPPWGGPDYKYNKEYDIETKLIPVGITELLNNCRNITKNIAVYLPRNSNKEQIIKAAGPGNKVAIEEHFLNDKFIALTAFYGDLYKSFVPDF